MTQDLYQIAMKFAGEKHSEQKMPDSSANYLLHIANVAMEVLCAYNFDSSFDINFAIQVAILHDTLEDTETTFAEIAQLFGQDIAEAVQALTKNESITSKENRMLDSLNRINSLRKEVGLVKIADRITNLQRPPKHWNKDKVVNYHRESQLIAAALQNKNAFLNERLESKIQVYLSKIETDN